MSEVRFTQIATLDWDIDNAYDVGEADMPFQFAYDSTNEAYGFMVGEVFHPFGGEVTD